MFPEGEYLRVKKVGQGYELLTLPSLTKSDMPFPLSDARLFSPDFSLFATTDAEYLTKLWNTDNFASRGQFIAGSISLQPYLEFSLDSRWIVGGNDILFNIVERQFVEVGNNFGRHIFSGGSTSYYNRNALWSLPDRTVLREFNEEKFVDFYGTSRDLLLVNASGALTLTDTSNSKEVVLLEGLDAYYMKLSPNDGLFFGLTDHRKGYFMDIWQISLP